MPPSVDESSQSPVVVPEHPTLPPLPEMAVDPDRVSRYLSDFAQRHPGRFDALQADPERLRALSAVFAFSHFLSEEVLRRPEWLLSLSNLHTAFTRADYTRRLEEYPNEGGVPIASAYDLALFRRRELLRIVIRDVLGFGTLAEITEELSNLADSILARALSTVTQELESRYGRPVTEDSEGRSVRARFAVVALGKLGGCELNYSSDIDLMFIYSGNGETDGPHVVTNREFFKKVANELTTLLSTYTAAGLCYRIDLRLRPEGTLGEVCHSLAAAQDYYANRARDWELQMLIKARIAAGDRSLGEALLDSAEASIYSTSLDFSTVETMSATRERIHEKVARRRLRTSDLDVKLARGGIRDIEFLVQCLQRLHGAREQWVRHGGTLLALSRLHEKDLLSSTEYARLVEAYEFLRRLEHRLQFEDDRQTHALPSKPEDLERIARRMFSAPQAQPNGITPGAQLLQDLNQHLEHVQAIYERIVHAQRPLSYSPPVPGAVVETAPSVSTPRPPPPASSLSEDLLRSLEASAPSFVSRLRSSHLRYADHTLGSFLEALRSRPSCLRLLDTHPIVAEWAMQIFELSPYLSEQLMREPELLDEMRRAADHPSLRLAFEGAAAPLNDIEALHRFFRREMFHIQVSSICLPEPIFQTLDRTSALAEFLVARAYRIALERALAHARAHATAEKPFEEPQSEMMVVALGRLGMREFDLGSDADLLFILPDEERERHRFWTRVTEHLFEILNSYTGTGTTLSIDTRLRPNGREGMLVQTESKYVEYFATRAEAWEGIAYMKARGVAGDLDRATTFLNKLQEVDWRRYGQNGRSKQDLRQMRGRLQREQGKVTPLKAGEGGYYDADFILMYLRLKGAGLFFKSLNTPERIDIVEKMGHLERADAEFLLRAATFFRALDHAIRLVTGRAEEKVPAAPNAAGRVAELVRRWTGSGEAGDLETELHSLSNKMRRLFDTIFAV